MSAEEIHFYDWQVRASFPYDWHEQHDFVDSPSELTEPVRGQIPNVNNPQASSNVIPLANHPDFKPDPSN
jgi:hypothetical protein